MTAVLRLLAKRLGTSLLVLAGVSMLIFAIARVIPGDPARIALGPNATKEQVAKLRADLHLDEPIWTQYGFFVADLAQGDLGTSLYTNRPVTTDIAQFLPATLELVIIAGIMMVAFGLPLGVISARYRGGFIDNSIRLVSLLGVSAPSFVWAVILMLLFAFYLPLFPIAGRISDTFTIAPEVCSSVSIPVAVKLSPFFSSIPNMALKFSEVGARGLVLFNRFYQPDFDLESLEVVPRLVLSDSDELRLPLRWIAILFGRVPIDLALTSGVHTFEDVLKGLMAGAKVTMLASEILANGIGRISEILEATRYWLQEHEYESVTQMQGSMSQVHVAEPAAFERANYVKMLKTWSPDPASRV